MEKFEKISAHLFKEIKGIIEGAKQEVAVNFNSVTTIMNWNIGMTINGSLLESNRAEYGKMVVNKSISILPRW